MSKKILKAKIKYQAICIEIDCNYVSNYYSSKEKASEKGYNHMLENEGHEVQIKVSNINYEKMNRD